MSIFTDGQVLFAAALNQIVPSNLSDGTAGSPAVAFASQAATGIYRRADGAMGYSVAGVEFAQLGPMTNGVLGTNLYGNNALRMQGVHTVCNPMGYGWSNSAVAQALFLNLPATSIAQVMGGFNSGNIGNTSGGAGSYTSRDSVTSIVQNYAPPVLFGSGGVAGASGVGITGTFTSTTFVPTTPLNPTQAAMLRLNMLIDTSDSPKFTGAITGWTLDGGGNCTSVTVSEWWPSPGTGTAGTPTGTHAYFNPITKIWAHNGIVTLGTPSFGTAAAGYEMDVNNNTGAYNSTTDSPTMWGFDAYSGGNAAASAGFIARATSGAPFRNAFVAKTGQNAGFLYNPTDGSAGIAFQSYAVSGTLAQSYDSTNGIKCAINVTNGSLELGAQGPVAGSGGAVSSAPYIDFHTTGWQIDYDARIEPTGGVGGTVGAANLRHTAATHIFRDNAANNITIGLGSSPSVTATTGAVIGFGAAGSIILTPSGSGSVQHAGPVTFPKYAVGSLPAAATYTDCFIHVTGSTTNNVFAYSDGTNWRWTQGGAVVS